MSYYKKLVDSKKSEISAMKVPLRLDVMTCESILAFIYKDSVLRTRKALCNIQKMFKRMDLSIYEDKPEAMSLIWVIMKTLEARLDEGFVNENSIITYCKESDDIDPVKEKIIDRIDQIRETINYEESRRLLQSIDTRLNYCEFIPHRQAILEVLQGMDVSDYKYFKDNSESMYDIATRIINLKRSIRSAENDVTFSLVDGDFENAITDSVTSLKERTNCLRTPYKMLNVMLGGGYMDKRLYIYLAFPGKGKSTILLETALGIKKYNKGLKAKDPSKRPTVLFITLENHIDETVERIFNMVVGNDDICNYTPKQVIKKLREDGHLKLDDVDNINIVIKYYDNWEIDTNDLYGIINDIEDDGGEVISLFVDYLKRIRPAQKGANEKEDLKNITNELKTLSKHFGISVVSAQQLNRTSSTVVDSALQANKEDVTRLVGRDGVGSAWEIVENSDWLCVVNPEVKQDTGDLYLTLKMLKRRYRSKENEDKMRRLEYFNQPFVPGSEIRLVEDADEVKTVALTSLANSFEGFEDTTKRGPKNAIDRQEVKSKSKTAVDDDFGLFDDWDEDQMD